MAKPIQNFWQLVQTHRIEIPIIQRDYVQGQNSSKTNPIREEFVKVIRTALKDAKTLHLNFIYGKINGIQNAQQLAKNTEAVKNMLSAVQSYSQSLDLDINFSVDKKKNNSDGTHYTSFIPLDGQQRLTTLYLLHWYLLKRLPKSDDLNLLKNFTYKIRPSSKDFCEALIDNDFEIDLTSKETLSEQIKDKSWYFLYWKKDPTVHSMLNMLDTIHQAFAKDSLDDIKNYWQRLTDETNPVIRFEFLNLKDYDLTDELYIKMNARGKPLTDFENFKAWLMEYVEKHEIKIDESLNWKHNLDTKWADLFWNNKGEGNYTIDQAYMNFFRNMFQIFYVKSKYIKDDRKVFNKNRALAVEKENGKYKFVPNDFFETLEILKDDLNTIFRCIDIMASNEGKITFQKDKLDFFSNYEKPILQGFLNGEMSYRDKVKFYAVFKFLEKYKDNFHKDKFFSWMRFFRNLLDNGAKNNVDNIDKFHNTLKNVDVLIENSDNLYSYLKTQTSLSGFDNPQVKEEIRKARLINDNVISKEYLVKFENHSYFKGQINFLLELSEENEAKFLEYGEKCAFIFGNEFKNDELLLERAFLAKHNYLVKRGVHHSFLKLGEWKSEVFKNSNRLLQFKDILDEIIDIKKPQITLNQNINLYPKSETDWRSLFIHYEKAIKKCHKKYVRFHYQEIRLLEGVRLSKSNGRNSELHSYCFYLKIKEEYDETSTVLGKIGYCPKRGLKNAPCAYVNAAKSNDDFDYAVDIYFVDNSYNLRFFNRKPKLIEDDVQKTLKKILHYKYNENSYFYLKIPTMKETEEYLLKICSKGYTVLKKV